VAQRSPDVHILHAEALALRGQQAAAEKVLKDWLAANPKHPQAARVHVAAARVLGISQAAVSQRVRAAAWVEDLRGRELVRHHLVAADKGEGL
jgi:hypothetical protein